MTEGYWRELYEKATQRIMDLEQERRSLERATQARIDEKDAEIANLKGLSMGLRAELNRVREASVNDPVLI